MAVVLVAVLFAICSHIVVDYVTFVAPFLAILGLILKPMKNDVIFSSSQSRVRLGIEMHFSAKSASFGPSTIQLHELAAAEENCKSKQLFLAEVECA